MGSAKSSALEGALLLLEILHRIPRQRFTTTAKLHEQLEHAGYTLSRRSLQRHLDALVDHFPIECDTRGKPYGYRWLDRTTGLGIPHLTPAEALLLGLAQQELAALLPARVSRSLASLLESARRQIAQHPDGPASLAAERRWLGKVARVPESQPLMPARVNPGVFEAVSDALYLERKLAITYRNARGKRLAATVHPLALVQQGQRSYLVCRFSGYDNERIVALARIVSAQMLDRPFDWPTSFNLARYIEAGHFGITQGRRVRVHFFIEATRGRHLVESPLSADQTVNEHPATAQTPANLEIGATVTETELLHRWLRSWGDALWGLEVTEIGAPTRPAPQPTAKGSAPP